MSVGLEFDDLYIWYKPSHEEDLIPCNNHIMIVDFQQRILTTSIDKVILNEAGEEITVKGYIITEPFDSFILEIP
jgi:hypothetical protein